MSEEFPEKLRYTKNHEWALKEGELVLVGITYHAQDSLGEIVFVDLPDLGKELKEGESFGAVESIKAVSDLYAPISGKVMEANEELKKSPEKINEDPYNASWMIKIKADNPSDLDKLMDAGSYKNLVESS